MTRKRFIKLLMSEGYSRNQANALARIAECPYNSYYVPRTHIGHEQATSSLCYSRKYYKINFVVDFTELED